MRKIITIIIISSLYFFAMLQVYNLFVSDFYYSLSKQQLDKQNYSGAMRSISSALSLNVKEPAYFRQLARVQLLQGNFAGALTSLQSAQSLNTENLATKRNAIPIYYALAVNDPNYKQQVLSYYSALKKEYPTDLGVLVDIAPFEKKLGALDNYMETVEIVRKLRPDILEWHTSFR